MKILIYQLVIFVVAQNILANSRSLSFLPEEKNSPIHSHPNLEVIFDEKSAPSGFLDFLLEGEAWQRCQSPDFIPDNEMSEIQGLLVREAKNFLKSLGYLDSKVSAKQSIIENKILVSLHVTTGEVSKFLGYEIDPKYPAWLSQLIRVLTGVKAESYGDYIRSVEALDLSDGMFSANQQVVFSNSDLSQEKYYRWFGDADLLIFPKKQEGSAFPGFTSLDYASALASIAGGGDKDSVWLNLSLSRYLEEINLIAGAQAARKGYPGLELSFQSRRVDNGFYMVIHAKGFKEALTLGEIIIDGLSSHEPQMVENWVRKEINLSNGQILKTSDFQNLRNKLFESGSFYHVGVRPSKLSGDCDLLITLRDHKHLPQLGADLAPEQEALRLLARFIFKKPNLKARFKIADKEISLFLDQRNPVISLKISSSDTKQGDLTISFSEDRFYLHDENPEKGGKQFLMSIGGVLSLGLQLNPSAEKSRNFSMGMGFSNMKKGLHIITDFTPAGLLYSKSEKLFDQVTKLDDEWILDSQSMNISIKTEQGEVKEVKLVTKPSLALPVAGLEILFTEENIGPQKDYLSTFERTETEKISHHIKNALNVFFQEPENSEEEYEHSLIKNLLLPKALDLLAILFSTDSVLNKNHSLGIEAPRNQKLDQAELNIEDYLAQLLGWESGTWPSQLLQTYFYLQHRDAQSFFTSIGQAMDSDQIGPLGNLLFGVLCQNINSHEGVRNFYFKTRLSNEAPFLIADLRDLNLMDEAIDWLLLVKESKELQDYLIKNGIPSDPFLLFLQQVSPSNSKEEQDILVCEFVNDYYEPFWASQINYLAKSILQSKAP